MTTLCETATLEAVLDEWAAAIVARDLAGVLRHHADDILLFDVVAPRQRLGLEAYRASWLEFFHWMGADGAFVLSDVHVTAGDRVAYATALIDCAGYEAGARVTFELRLTVGFERRGERWVIAHEHHSEPVMPAAGAQ